VSISIEPRSRAGAWRGRILQRDTTVVVHLRSRINALVAMEEVQADQESRNVHKDKTQDTPSITLIRQPKVEFPQMTNCILLVLPPYSLTTCTKAALKPTLGLLQKAIIRQTGLEAARKVHALDLGQLETTNESVEGDSIFEHRGNPMTGEVGTTTQAAQGLQFARIGLILGYRLLSGLVINSPCSQFVGNPGLVAHHSARLRSPGPDLI